MSELEINELIEFRFKNGKKDGQYLVDFYNNISNKLYLDNTLLGFPIIIGGKREHNIKFNLINKNKITLDNMIKYNQYVNNPSYIKNNLIHVLPEIEYPTYNITEKDLDKHLSYLQLATLWGLRSKCPDKKVGALLVKDGTIISSGYNGAPNNYCEDCLDENGNTKWEILHAETNAITRVAKSQIGTLGSTIYTTYSPCKDCAKLIVQSGIDTIVFNDCYKDISGLKLIHDCNINIIFLGVNLNNLELLRCI